MEYTVACYTVSRTYGGPEEGGWYYDYGNLLRRNRAFPCEETALAFCSKLNRKLWSLGFDCVVAKVYKGEPPYSYPETRPRYC